ncbi:MAG: alpha-L-arabinofuranosidase C-terminal domain-containing protein, partial [Propionicimonas sp.]|nr:alpha-L-arabinofuranosidase C-terminal domain-containing protein [Propionicimonas sp.]
ALIEYVNVAGGSAWADLRRSHGYPEPWGVKYWCLGNEMDGPWQTGQKSARDYAVLARETAKALRLIDPEAQLIACGSSHERMPTFGEWERVVLEEAWDHIDYLSLHAYYEPGADDSVLLESGHSMDQFIRGVIATADAVKARKASTTDMMLAFDEWNVIHPDTFGPQVGDWVDAGSPLIEGEYSPLDAVVVGDLLTTLLQHVDRVRIAAIAQLVNVLAPIMTTPQGATRQTIFHPFAVLSTTADGTVLRGALETPQLPSDRFGAIPGLNTAAVLSADGTTLTLSAVNRSLTDPLPLTVDTTALGADVVPVERIWMTSGNPLPQVGGSDLADNPLPPASWTVQRYTIGRAC